MKVKIILKERKKEETCCCSISRSRERACHQDEYSFAHNFPDREPIVVKSLARISRTFTTRRTVLTRFSHQLPDKDAPVEDLKYIRVIVKDTFDGQQRDALIFFGYSQCYQRSRPGHLLCNCELQRLIIVRLKPASWIDVRFLIARNRSCRSIRIDESRRRDRSNLRHPIREI